MFAYRTFTGAHLHHQRWNLTKTLAILHKYQVFAYRLYHFTKPTQFSHGTGKMAVTGAHATENY